MSFKITQSAYRQLVDEDLAWLMKQPRTLERDHVEMIVRQSVETYYPGGEPVVPLSRAQFTEVVFQALKHLAGRQLCTCTEDARGLCSKTWPDKPCACKCHPENR